jgi:ATP-dependent DNA helicase 2 subunit 1
VPAEVCGLIKAQGVLSPDVLGMDSNEDEELSEGLSITRIDDLLAQMRFREAPKRALFSLPLRLAEGLTIGIKG